MQRIEKRTDKKDSIDPRNSGDAVLRSETIISRKRKKYKFALFAEMTNCYEVDTWKKRQSSSLTIELGSGTGYFLVELAKRYPDRQFVAVDVKADRLQAGARRALDVGVNNISFLRAHADQLHELFPKRSISELWLTFSDPFPKKRHAKHRLTHPHFLKTYQWLLEKGGRLHMKTDSHALFDWSIEQLISEGWILRSITYDLHQSEFSTDFKVRTTFEERFLVKGMQIYALEASC